MPTIRSGLLHASAFGAGVGASDCCAAGEGVASGRRWNRAGKRKQSDKSKNANAWTAIHAIGPLAGFLHARFAPLTPSPAPAGGEGNMCSAALPRGERGEFTMSGREAEPA